LFSSATKTAEAVKAEAVKAEAAAIRKKKK